MNRRAFLPQAMFAPTTLLFWAFSAFTALMTFAACGGSAPAKPPPAPTAVEVHVSGASVRTLQISTESLQVDKVGGRNGFLYPDGLRDLAFTAEVTGPISALFLQSTDERGEPDNLFRVNTMFNAEEAPMGLGGSLELGQFSPGIGVYEGGKLINRSDGSVKIAEGLHTLTLYTSNPGALHSGSRVRLFAVLADKSVIHGPILAIP